MSSPDDFDRPPTPLGKPVTYGQHGTLSPSNLPISPQLEPEGGDDWRASEFSLTAQVATPGANPDAIAHQLAPSTGGTSGQAVQSAPLSRAENISSSAGASQARSSQFMGSVKTLGAVSPRSEASRTRSDDVQAGSSDLEASRHSTQSRRRHADDDDDVDVDDELPNSERRKRRRRLSGPLTEDEQTAGVATEQRSRMHVELFVR